MYNCECFRIGGPFIGADPNCPAHGTQATDRRERIEHLEEQLFKLSNNGKIEPDVWSVLQALLNLVKEGLHGNV